MTRPHSPGLGDNARPIRYFLDLLQEAGVMTIDQLGFTYIFKDGEIDNHTLWNMVEEAATKGAPPTPASEGLGWPT